MRRLSSLLLASLTLTVAVPATAQLVPDAPSARRGTGTGRIIGLVKDIGGRPLVNAEAVLLGRDRAVASAADGHFAFDGMAAGDYMVLVRAIGHAPVLLSLTLNEGEVYDLRADLEQLPYQLPELEARSRAGFGAETRYADLEARLRRGQSRVLTNDYLRRFPNLDQAVALAAQVRFIRNTAAGVGGSADPWRNALAAATPDALTADPTQRNQLMVSLNGGMPTPAVTLADYRPGQIEALEFVAPEAVQQQWPWLPFGAGVIVVWL
ncbi:MAG: carboxypeptidase regulatory-like domain-containing protein [Gemmatimonadales bacterium]|nr:carboxypeptidase regulatory-like domain-containing protein [Gemmatimonadales bacterium]